MVETIKRTDKAKQNYLKHRFPKLSKMQIFLSYFILVFAITYILSDNILDISVTLRKFVDFMAFLFPGVAEFGKYTKFLQVAQLVYSVCIVTLPIAVMLAYKASKNDLNKDSGAMKKRLKNIRSASLLFSASCFCFMLLIIYWLPGGPIRTYHDVFGEMYNEKWAFSIVICVIFICFILSVGELIVTIKLKRNRKIR